MPQRSSSSDSPTRAAAQANADAARALTQATRELTAALRGAVGSQGAPSSAAGRDSISAAVASGVLMGLRRAQQDAIIETGSQGSSPTGIPGMGYGRMGASITGSGQRASTYGAIGGAIGYAVGGPIGGLVGGMLGGLLGGSEKPSKPPLQRQWYNTPEEFEIEAYLYNLRGSGKARGGHGFSGVRVDRVEITINGQGAQAGVEAGRAFAAYLGRHVALNSAVAQAPGYV